MGDYVPYVQVGFAAPGAYVDLLDGLSDELGSPVDDV